MKTTPTPPRSKFRMPPALFAAALKAHPPVPYDLTRLADDLFMPAACPIGARFYAERIDVLVSSYEFSVDPGGTTVSTAHLCPICGHQWEVSGWPAVMVGLLAEDRRSARSVA